MGNYKVGKIRAVRLGDSQQPESQVYTRRRSTMQPDEHAECMFPSRECAVDIITENKTIYDPFLLSVFFLQDSDIGKHSHPCGAVYYVLMGTMCFYNDDWTCLEKGESYWTSPDNHYTEKAKQNTKILVLGFQCPPVFYQNYFL